MTVGVGEIPLADFAGQARAVASARIERYGLGDWSVQDLMCQQESQSEQTRGPDRAGLVQELVPVGVALDADQLGDVADPAQSVPAVLRPVGAEVEKQYLRRQARYLRTGELGGGRVLPQNLFIQVEAELGRDQCQWISTVTGRTSRIST